MQGQTQNQQHMAYRIGQGRNKTVKNKQQIPAGVKYRPSVPVTSVATYASPRFR